MKNKLNLSAGVTLIEILIGIVISVIIMAAMYASYDAVNSSYSQITDRAKISQSGRNILGMMVRDIRQAGFKYFEDTIANSNEPIKITENKGGPNASDDSDCDHIDIVYGDVTYDSSQLDPEDRHTFHRYKITYYCEPSKIIDKTIIGLATTIDTNAVYKSKLIWIDSDGDGIGTWGIGPAGSKTYQAQIITDYVEDLVFIPKDDNGLEIDPPPTNNNSNKEKVLSIKSVEVALTVRSVKKFYNYTKKADGTKRKIVDIEDRNAAVENTDLILRDTITVSVNTRNIGLQ